MNHLSDDTLQEALTLLGKVLELRNSPPCHFVVVGGAALLTAGIVARATRDVDVIARREIPEGDLAPISGLPEEVSDASKAVALELGLAENWFNAATSFFVTSLTDFPAEVWTEMQTISFGSRLQLSFVGRLGLIHFKFSAAIDPRRDRRLIDREDLQKLAPTEEEVIRVHSWLRREELLNSANHAEFNKTLRFIDHGGLVSRFA